MKCKKELNTQQFSEVLKQKKIILIIVLHVISQCQAHFKHTGSLYPHLQSISI